METVLGYKDVVVKLRDGSDDTVRVSQLQVEQFEQAFEVADSEIKSTELICGKPFGYSKTLTIESYNLLRTEATAINQEGFFAFAERQTKRLDEKLARRMKAMPDTLMKSLAQKAVESVSPPSSVGLQPQ